MLYTLTRRSVGEKRLQLRVASGTGSPLDELLPAVDVVGAACKGCIRHDVYGERSDVGRSHDASDRQRNAELLATRVQLIAEERRRQWCIDKPGGDEVDANRREFERQIFCHDRHRGRESRDESESLLGAAATGAAHEEQGSSLANLVCGETSNLERKKQMGLNVAACFFKIEFGQWRVIGTGTSDQHVVDGTGQFAKELREALKVGGVESRSMYRCELARYAM